MPARALVRIVLGAVCLAGAIVSLMAYTSQTRLMDAAVEFETNLDFPRALREIRASDSALNPSAYRDAAIAVSLLHTGHPAKGERVIARAAHREPANMQPWTTLTRIQVARGRLAAARASWAHARRLNPHLPPQLPLAL